MEPEQIYEPIPGKKKKKQLAGMPVVFTRKLARFQHTVDNALILKKTCECPGLAVRRAGSISLPCPLPKHFPAPRQPAFGHVPY